MEIKPLGKRVLIRRSKVQTTKGGILLPDTAKEKPKEGEVIAVGPGEINDAGERELLSVKKGDRILFASYGGTEVKNENDEELLILREDEILGILV